MAEVPGVVIDHIPASTRSYVGSPSIIVMPDGIYLASHDIFGPGAGNDTTRVYRSTDRGESWETTATLKGQVWSNLFLHEGALYIFGTDHCDEYGGRLNGVVVIRRSRDGGQTWTEPVDARTGRLTDEEGWHCAPVPVIVHEGRLWRAFEFAPEPERREWRAVVLSAPEDADLLDRDSWLFSEQLEHTWSESQWIEGNIVVAPDNGLIDLLRVNDRPNEKIPDQAAIVHVDPDGIHLIHDHDRDLIDFPGGGTKFTVRYDQDSGRYISLVNIQDDPPAYRNILYLSSSADLRSWQVHTPLLHHPDPRYHAFQYVDWVFDGSDIIFASRTAYDDGMGGAHGAHDANFLTFHRIDDFRSLLNERIDG